MISLYFFLANEETVARKVDRLRSGNSLSKSRIGPNVRLHTETQHVEYCSIYVRRKKW